jgi:hypothetical protein
MNDSMGPDWTQGEVSRWRTQPLPSLYVTAKPRELQGRVNEKTVRWGESKTGENAPSRLTLIFIGPHVFDCSPFLSSFVTFHKRPHTLECIVEQGQWVPQKLAVTSARAIHTDTPSMVLCKKRIRPCSVHHGRQAHSLVKNKEVKVVGY